MRNKQHASSWRSGSVFRAGLCGAALWLTGCAAPATLSIPAADITTEVTRHYPEQTPLGCNKPDDNLLASVVRVATGDGGDASGVVVGRDLVLTAAHVVRDAGLTLVRVGERYHEASVLGQDDHADLALLSVFTGRLKPVPVSRRGLGDLEPVWAIGFPFALDQVTTTGHFRSEDNGRLFTSAPINAGASGGGLVRCANGNFELAGMIRGYGAYRVGGELVRLPDLSISTPARRIEDFIVRQTSL